MSDQLPETIRVGLGGTDALTAARERLRSRMAGLETHQNRIADYQHVLAYLKEQIKVVEPDAVLNRAMLSTYRDRHQAHIRATEESQGYITAYTAEIPKIKQQIDSLAARPPTKNDLTLVEAEAMLYSVDGVRPESVKFTMYSGSPAISWIMQDVILQIPEFHPRWINGGKRHVSLRLAPLEVIYTDSNSVFCSRPVQKGGVRHAYNNNIATHPHTPFTDGTPCLGDFAGAFAEAISSGDLLIAASLYRMFLEQASPRDTAGKSWPRWIRHALTANMTTTNCNSDATWLSTLDARYKFETDDAGFVTVFKEQRVADTWVAADPFTYDPSTLSSNITA